MNGVWKSSHDVTDLPDPLTGDIFLKVSNASHDEIKEYAECTKRVPKHGLHNPLKNPERYNMYGDICAKVAEEFHKP